LEFIQEYGFDQKVMVLLTGGGVITYGFKYFETSNYPKVKFPAGFNGPTPT
jgi:hypothetical protein